MFLVKAKIHNTLEGNHYSLAENHIEVSVPTDQEFLLYLSKNLASWVEERSKLSH